MKNLLLIAGIVICSLSAHADIYIGANARTAAMAGAGIATINISPSDIFDANGSQVLNPATLSETGMRFSIHTPNVDMRTQGIDLGESLSLLGSSKISAGDAFKLAKDFGDGPARVDVNAGLGFGLPYSTIRGGTSITVQLEPNDEFQCWAKTGVWNVNNNAKADIYGIGITSIPEVAAGFGLPIKSSHGKYSIGARIKPTNIYYSHYVVDSSTYLSGTAKLSGEMNGSSYLKKSSIGADIGLLYQSKIIDGLAIGVVSNNAIEPKGIDFGPGTPPEVNKSFAPRTYSAGATYQKSFLTAAVDFNDLFHKFGKTQMCAGAEVRLPLKIALRAGYNSNLGFSAGLGIWGFDISYSGKAPYILSQMISF